jgi:hypothetical protein
MRGDANFIARLERTKKVTADRSHMGRIPALVIEDWTKTAG